MKLSAERVAENRERVLDTALRLFRERGFDGVSVADLMREAGLTHGGFYNHFKSKADLEARACAKAFEGSADALSAAGAAPAGEGRKLGLLGYISRYLSRPWRDAEGPTCPMVAFGVEAARGGNDIGESYAAGLNTYLAGLAALTEVQGGNAADARRRAIVLAATLTGALGLARSVRRSDPALSDEILSTVREALTQAALDGPT